MTDRLREAAQAALEALERARAYVYETDRPQTDAAMDALRAALAEQEAEPVATAWLRNGEMVDAFPRPPRSPAEFADGIEQLLEEKNK